MKCFATLFACLAVASLCSCVNYRIHVKVLPPDTYKVRLNDETDLGSTDSTGTADFTLMKMSKASTPKISIENKKLNGYAVLDAYEPTLDSKNLDSLSVAKVVNGYREYSLRFLVERAQPKPHVPLRSRPARVSYWIVNSDTNDYSYFGLKRHLDKYFEDHTLSWMLADAELQKAISSAGGVSKDSLSPEVLKSVVRDTLDYLILFFGYSIGGSKQPAINNIVGAAVLTTLGILTAPMTGMLFFAAPGKTEVEITEPSVFCTIYSVRPNKCIFRGKESLEGSDQNIKVQIDSMVSNLFQRIDKVTGR
jgi:hypothetical protein